MLLHSVRDSPHWTLVKWSIMSAVVFWTLVYQLAGEATQFPEFVYVNF